jgi:hypothetical protein
VLEEDEGNLSMIRMDEPFKVALNDSFGETGEWKPELLVEIDLPLARKSNVDNY